MSKCSPPTYNYISWGSVLQHNVDSIATDSSGNVYTTDVLNDRIEKYNNSGTYITAFGSTGSGPGQFNYPGAIAIDSSDNIYVVDRDNNRIEKITSDGTYLTSWDFGTSGSPEAIAADNNGNVFTATLSGGKIFKFTSNGTLIKSWICKKYNNYSIPIIHGIAFDTSGNIFVAAQEVLQKYTTDGTFMAQWVGSSGYKAIAIDGSDKIYLVGFLANYVRIYTQ